MEERLSGGRDGGAVLVDGTVRRRLRPWTATTHHLLHHLESRGFTGAPRVLGTDGAHEVLSLLPGDTVGDTRPWPAWTHSLTALDDIGHWLRAYHRAVSDYVPPPDAVWREGRAWEPGMVVGHGDPAPYNAVWDSGGLVGLVDWDNAGPVRLDEDVAWVAFSWTPLHARAVVSEEGFRDFARRRERLDRLLTAYGWPGTADDLLEVLARRLETQVATMRATAARGDDAYRVMLDHGLDRHLQSALAELTTI